MDSTIDPEVAADLALRDASMRDPERTRHAVRVGFKAGAGYQQPETAELWKCRGCKQPLGVTADTVWTADMFDRMLRSRGEDPIDREKACFCVECRIDGQAMAAHRNRKSVDAIAALVRELRGGTANPEPPGPPPAPAREVEVVRHLRLMRHPDVDGLCRAIAEKRGLNPNKKKKPT